MADDGHLLVKVGSTILLGNLFTQSNQISLLLKTWFFRGIPSFFPRGGGGDSITSKISH